MNRKLMLSTAILLSLTLRSPVICQQRRTGYSSRTLRC